MKKTFLFFAFITLLNHAFAQQDAQLKGKVWDTLSKAPLSQAVVSLLHKKDSTLLTFTRSGKDGTFHLPNVAKGKYMVMVTFPKFADYVDVVNVDAPVVDMGTIALTQKATLLKEVVIQSGRAIRIKGDTTEYVADSFIVKEGATVEDLLKQFPGFQVDSKGQITAHGQRVQKVLVDGEEFFGDDPTLATQNIAAKAVQKVQVYDNKSEQEQLKGLGGGGSQGKTIDIKLKENSKKGAFGKVYAGSDFQKYHDAKGLYNRFVGKKKVSLYGTKSTTGTGSLNWEERNKLGIENDLEYDEIGGYYYSIGSGDEFNDWSLRGLPDSYTAGALFVNKWNEDKQGVNTSYRFNRLSTRNEHSRLQQTILPDGLLYTNSIEKSNGLNQQHALNGKYEWKLDSLTSFKFTTAGIYKTTHGFKHTNRFSLNEKQEYLNKNDQVTENETERKQLDNQLAYKQLFKKKDRQLLMTLRFGLVEDDQNGMLNSVDTLYDNGVFRSDSITDQQKFFKGNSKTIGSKITFSEPLSSKWTLVADYSFNNNNSASERTSFNKANNGKYEILDSLYSNSFDLNASSHSSMAVLKYIGKKTRLAFGSGISAIQLGLHDLDKDKKITYNFLNITPQATYSYQIKQQTRFAVNYRGTTRQPNMNQLQPIRDNTDQLNIYIGNPDLKVGFNHRINTSYSSYKVLTGTNLYLDASYSFTQNDISNSSIIVNGKRTYTPVNVNGNNNWNFWSYWSYGQGEKKLRHSIQLNANGGRNINFINSKKAINNSANFDLYYGIGYDVKDKYNFFLRPRIGYNSSRSSLQTSIDNNYFSYGGSVNGYVMLPGKIEISSDVDANLRQRIAAFDRNTNIVQWNASISKKVLKDKSGKIIFLANDILNQNKGFSRIINSNFVTDERYLRVSRYFLLKFEWSFNKMPTGK